MTELIAHETLAVVLPSLLHEGCPKWTRLAMLQLLVKLTELHALFGLGLGNLCRPLVTWARAEGPTAPVALLELLSRLARMTAVFPRQKGNRPDSLRAGGMATLLHEADATRMLTQWFEFLETRHSGAHRQLRFGTWSPLRQLSVWRIAEGLARHVPLSCTVLVQAGVSEAVRDELLVELKKGVRSPWKRDKTTKVAALILLADGLCVNSREARLGLQQVRVDGGAPGQVGIVYMVLPLLILPERADAVLLTAGLELLAHLVERAPAETLRIVSNETLSGVDPLLRLIKAP